MKCGKEREMEEKKEKKKKEGGDSITFFVSIRDPNLLPTLFHLTISAVDN